MGSSGVARLVDRLASLPTPEAAAHVLDAAVAERAGGAQEPDAVVRGLVELLEQRPAAMGAVRFASHALSVGERRLHRRCCAAVGYGPKTLERALRFQRALRIPLFLSPLIPLPEAG